MNDNDLKDERIARLTALLDCIDDTLSLYPDSPYSMSRLELVNSTSLQHMKTLTIEAICNERDEP